MVSEIDSTQWGDPPNAKRRKDYWDYIAPIVSADTSARVEILWRWSLVMLAAISLTFATGRYLFAIWGAVYLLMDRSYLRYLASLASPVDRTQFITALMLSWTTSGLFIAMPIYLMTSDVSSLRFIAICGFLAMCLHSLLRHRGLIHLAVWDCIQIMAGTIVLLWTTVRDVSNVIDDILIGVGAVTLLLYYGMNYLGISKLRTRLRTAEEMRAEAQKMEAVGRLTGGVAHDFNNILTVVIGNLDLYHELENKADRDFVIREAFAAAERGATLTSQLLSFSRRAQLNPETIDLQEFLSSLGTMFDRVLPETVTLRIDDAPAGLTCHADRNQLASAMLNLVINARDAMGEKGQILVFARPVTYPGLTATPPRRQDGTVLSGPYCAISVCDTGPGIPEELSAEVLTPFFTTKPIGKGSGLGLPMVLGFAEQTEGAFTLTNKARGGLEAQLVLPRHPR